MEWETIYVSGKYQIRNVSSGDYKRPKERVWEVVFDDREEIALEDTLRDAKAAADRHADRESASQSVASDD